MRKKNLTFLILLATNLRLAFTSITPIFSNIQKSLQISSTTSSLLITLPLIMFAICSVFTDQIFRKFEFNQTMTGLLLLLISAIILRPYNQITLLIGTIIIGFVLALLNVIMPSLVLNQFAKEKQKITGYYSLATSLTAAVGLLLIVPLTKYWGWQLASQLFSLPAILTLVAWFTLKSSHPAEPTFRLTFNKTVTNKFKIDAHLLILIIFMGLQAFVFYGLSTWLPSIFESCGATNSLIAILMFLFQFSGLLANFIFIQIRHIKHILVLAAASFVLGAVILLANQVPMLLILSAILLGLSTSLIFTTTLFLLAKDNKRGANSDPAKQASLTMSFGYALAALAPITLSCLHDILNSWSLLILLLLLLMLLASYLAYRLDK
ncbi:major facilitator superfamily transporter [Weissella oryzae SG25]|uniref:Major facilitator superfamily transporter n=1 Tax=Weissella oryzae (strain DSM 25784 / JCM 18191 / LMG 30913 / SG25) TaxID=1329250 RepID=A0A069D1A1_WEIOS|nr:MFS transporter [Weissella oryzae]GAK31136.1 major facilitator superfamily transporter [Weissella oryzae SG25]